MTETSSDRPVRAWIVFAVALFLLVGLSVWAAIHRAGDGRGEPAGTDRPGEDDRLEVAWKRRILALQDVAEFRDVLARATSPADAVQTVRALSAKGLPRLSDEELVQRVSLLAALVGRADEETCAAIFRNSPTPEQLHAAFLRLDPPAMEAWIDLTARAALAELKQTEAESVNEVESTDALNAVVKSLPPETGDRLSTILNSGAEASDEDACWAARTFYAKVAQIGEPYDRILARGLVRN